MINKDFSTAFQQLDRALLASQHLWRPQPFIHKDLPWQHSHPHISKALLALSDKQANELHYDQQHRASWFQALEPALCASLFAFSPAAALANTAQHYTAFDSLEVPGRKWQQIIAFASSLPDVNLALVDWCSGKGHLARIIQRHRQQPVHCLEWDAALVSAGMALAEKQKLDIRYHQHDVMQTLPAECSGPDYLHTALHACGDLHASLLHHITDSKAQAVTLAPCCYHKIASTQYQPFSIAAQQSLLRLNRQDLHLCVQDTVTAGTAERGFREQERIWRMGFDALQRKLSACDAYRNIPSIKRMQLRGNFQEFCQWAAESCQLPLPASIDYEHYLQLGQEKYRQVFRLELLRRLFNRPLEHWLVLDRALYLEQYAYKVTISRFCNSSDSPRNLLLQAQRIDA